MAELRPYPLRALITRMFREQKDVTRKLRALWALHVTGAADASFLRGILDHEDEHIRSWAIRLACLLAMAKLRLKSKPRSR